ncbi:MAG TPA: hypothetical protein VJ123_05445 [Anaerolineales bacterium]|nr:hypothetical protein [Anaerolineales bacterium]
MAEDFEVEGAMPEESSNRTFIIAAVGLGALILLSTACVFLYALVLAPRQRASRDAQQTSVALQNIQSAQTMTQQAQPATAAPSATPTRTATPTLPPTATSTEVVVIATATNTVIVPTSTTPTLSSLTATAAAQQTAAAAITRTATPPATALPATGFGDQAGLPGLALAGSALIIVILLARRLRSTSTR